MGFFLWRVELFVGFGSEVEQIMCLEMCVCGVSCVRFDM